MLWARLSHVWLWKNFNCGTSAAVPYGAAKTVPVSSKTVTLRLVCETTRCLAKRLIFVVSKHRFVTVISGYIFYVHTVFLAFVLYFLSTCSLPDVSGLSTRCFWSAKVYCIFGHSVAVRNKPIQSERTRLQKLFPLATARTARELFEFISPFRSRIFVCWRSSKEPRYVDCFAWKLNADAAVSWERCTSTIHTCPSICTARIQFVFVSRLFGDDKQQKSHKRFMFWNSWRVTNACLWIAPAVCFVSNVHLMLVWPTNCLLFLLSNKDSKRVSN